MPIHALGGAVPDIHPEASVHPDAVEAVASHVRRGQRSGAELRRTDQGER